MLNSKPQYQPTRGSQWHASIIWAITKICEIFNKAYYGHYYYNINISRVQSSFSHIALFKELLQLTEPVDKA